MIQYEVFCEDILLGRLEIREGQHRYVPCAENVEQVQRRVPLPWEMVRGRDWGKPIPFFQERIENARRFGTEKRIRYHTDLFDMRMVAEEAKAATNGIYQNSEGVDSL